MIVWQGLGAYAFVIPFAFVLGTALAAQALFGAETAKHFGRATFGLGLLASAGLVYRLAQNLARRPIRQLIDKATGQEFTIRERHTMFWVPLRYWSIFYAIVGAILVVIGLFISPEG